MAAKCINLPPVRSTVTSFPLSDAPLPTPAGWWCHLSSLPLLLARDDDDGSDIHCCSICRVVVVLVVMLVVVLLLSVVPSHCCCHRRRCHHQTTTVQWPSPSPRPPPSPLPLQSHSLQLSVPPSPRCHFHRRRRCHGHCPRRRINNANSLNAAIAGCHHRLQPPTWLLPSPLHSLQPLLPPLPSPPLSPSPQSVLTSPPALIWRRLMLGLAVMTARQGVTPCSSRHGREVWR